VPVKKTTKKTTLPKKKKRAKAVAMDAGRRKRRSPDDILNRMVQAASEEFKRSGYAGTTTATIARNADVTEAQLFRYFGSKSNLFRETIFKPINQHFQNFTNKHVPDGGKTATKTLTHLYTSELQSFISEHAEMLTSLVVAQTYDKGTSHGVGEIDSLQTYFERGAVTMFARIKGKAKVDPKLMVRVSFVAVLACIMFKDWIFPKGMASDAEIEAAINDFVLEGIGANSTKD
jgi:Bacterial regulatory proteins, tetR family